MSRALKKHGYTAGQVRDRDSGEPNATTIEYGAGAETDAHNVATPARHGRPQAARSQTRSPDTSA